MHCPQDGSFKCREDCYEILQVWRRSCADWYRNAIRRTTFLHRQLYAIQWLAQEGPV